MKKHIFKYFLFFICLFFVFDINVRADLKESGECFYTFNGTGNEKIYIRISQSYGSYKYYYYEGDKDISAAEWKEEKSGVYGYHISLDTSASFYDNEGKYFKACPNYAHKKVVEDNLTNAFKFKLPGTYIYFSDNSSEEEYTDVASVEKGSTMTDVKSLDGLGVTCAETMVGWLEEIPDVNSLGENELHCLYTYEDDKGCYVLQINSDSNDVSYKANFDDWSSKKGVIDAFSLSFVRKRDKKFEKFFKKQTLCPNVKVNFGKNKYGVIVYTPNSKDGKVFTLSKSLSSEFGLNDSVDRAIIVGDGKTIKEISDCSELFPPLLTEMLKNIINFVKVLIPVILIGLGVFDFGMAVFASDEDKMKKAQSKFIKRLIIGAVIFMIPNILKVLLTLAHGIWPIVDATLCGII